MGLSRNSACLQINNEEEQSKLLEYSMGAEEMTVYRSFEYSLKSVSYEQTNGLEKKQKKLRKNHCGQGR